MDNVTLEYQQSKKALEQTKEKIRNLLGDMAMNIESENFLGTLLIADHSLQSLCEQAAMQKMAYEKASINLAVHEDAFGDESDPSADIQNSEQE